MDHLAQKVDIFSKELRNYKQDKKDQQKIIQEQSQSQSQQQSDDSGDDDDLKEKKVVKYNVGDFSKFAVEQQNQIQSIQKYMDQVLSQACYSYLQQLKSLKNSDEIFSKKTQTEESLQQLVGKGNTYRYLTNRKQFFLKLLKDKNQTYKSVAKKYYEFMTYARDLMVIDGKLIQKQQLKIQERIQHMNQLIIPTKQQGLYVKIGQGKIPTKVFFSNNQFVEKNKLQVIGPEAKQKVKQMVVKFLKSKNMLSHQDGISKLIDDKIRKIQKQALE